MTIDVPAIAFLASPQGHSLLLRLTWEELSENNTLKLLTQLRRDTAPEEARAALEMARLRLKAVEKFGGDAAALFFTREALEQASSPLVRHYRAEQIVRPSPLTPLPQSEGNKVVSRRVVRIIDACCGIGADALALAQAGGDVLGLDIDPVRVEIARYNAAALGLTERFAVADVRDGLPEADAVFFDPARRDAQGQRLYDVERYQPPLSTIRDWNAALVAVKLSPGVELAQLAAYAGGVEFISVSGDLKEAVLWLGAGWTGRRATLLAGGSVHRWEDVGRGVSQTLSYDDAVILSEPRGWLVEPDAALLRAGLVQDAAQMFGGYLLDETIAYFTTDTRPESAWVRAWQILDWMPFNVKKLRAYLRDRGVGSVTVKKRGSAVTPEMLIPQLKLKGDQSRVLVLTRYRGQPVILICADYVL
jgi:SAM-dependent methyltransferase